jgi:hypothetical protein
MQVKRRLAYSPRPDFFRYLTVAAAAIIALASCSYTTAQKPTPFNKLDPVTPVILPVAPPKKISSTQPREIKIQLTLTTPADLRVKQGASHLCHK